MEPHLQTALEGLRALLPLEEAGVEQFLRDLEAVVAMQDPSAIEPILGMVDDACSLGGVNDAILNALEAFPSATYVPHLLAVMPGFRARSARWSESELKKFLWRPSDTAILRAEVGRAPPEVRRVVQDMLAKIGATSRDLRAACDLVVSAC